MTRKHFLSVLVIFLLVLSSCKTQEQVRTLNMALSSSYNGDVATTLAQFDSIQRFSNPIINRKFKKLKKKYLARFRSKTEKKKASSKNRIVNDICLFYHEYWRVKLLDKSLKSDSVLYDRIAHYLFDNELTELNYEELTKTIKDDSELSKVLKKEGFSSRFLLLNGIQDVLIWDKQDQLKYLVDLPETKIDVNVILIENYVLKGASEYASFGISQIGGWASSGDSSLYCNKGAYNLTSEKFEISYLKHESIHFIDLQEYSNLESPDLEYRAKLIELSYCTKKSIYKRIYEFILSASDETRDNSHPYANHHLISQLSKKLFDVEFEADILKWKALTPETINNASLELLQKGTHLLNENPLKHQLIEVMSN